MTKERSLSVTEAARPAWDLARHWPGLPHLERGDADRLAAELDEARQSLPPVMGRE